MSRPWLVCLFFAALAPATRLPWAPNQLFTFDDVNLAYSIGRFDIGASQPHPPAIALWQGPRLMRTLRGAAPLRLDLPAGARIIRMLNPRTDFYRLAQQNFTPSPSGSLGFTGLPTAGGSQIPGEYELAW